MRTKDIQFCNDNIDMITNDPQQLEKQKKKSYKQQEDLVQANNRFILSTVSKLNKLTAEALLIVHPNKLVMAWESSILLPFIRTLHMELLFSCA